LEEIIAKDPKLHTLTEENQILTDKCRVSERNLNDIQYAVLEKETLQALSIKQKDQEMENRKKLHDECEKWRNQLEDTIKANDAKVQQKLRSSECPEIKVLNAQLEKEMREIFALNDKLKELEKRENEFMKQTHNSKKHRDHLAEKRRSLEALHQDLSAKTGALETPHNDLVHDNEGLALRLQEVTEFRKKISDKLREIEEQHITLMTSHNFLAHHIKLEDDMKAFNIHELMAVQKANQEVNDSILHFMNKWETLKKMSSQIN